MERVLEGVMYLAFTLAAVPSAYVDLRALTFYRSNPELLASRDAAPEVFAFLGAAALISGPLVVGTIVALYLLAVGSKEVRIMSGTLLGAWVVDVSVDLANGADFRSFERLYSNAYASLALALLPLLCLAARLASAGILSPRAWREWWGNGL